jgi:hypothetical protein
MSGWRVNPEMRVSIAGSALGIIQAFEQEGQFMRYGLSDYEWGVIRPLTGSWQTAKPSQINAAPEGISGRALHRYRSLDWQHAFNLAPKAKTPFPTLSTEGVGS